MTHAELIASIPTKVVECMRHGKKEIAVYRSPGGEIYVIDAIGKQDWCYAGSISPLPERVVRPMTDREMFGLFAQGAEVRDNETWSCNGWCNYKTVEGHEYRLPGSTEWLKCEAEVVE